MPRWLRSLNTQLFLWAVLPVTFVIIAISFSGVYAHQSAMRDFVSRRDLALAHAVARALEDAIGHGFIGLSQSDVSTWLPRIADGHSGTVQLVNGSREILAQVGPTVPGAGSETDPFYGQPLPTREGVRIAQADGTELLLAFSRVAVTDWWILVVEPVEELMGPLLRFPSLVPLVAASAGIISVLVLTFGWATIVRPLQRLSQAAGQVAWGDYSAISRPVAGVQEVRDLREALADMVGRIRDYETAMRDYAGAMTHGQEVERARLARELHDGPVQDLIVLRQQAEMAQRMLERDQEEQARETLQAMRAAEQRTVEELRRVIGNLRPTYLEDLGLVPALEMLVKEANSRSDARVRLEVIPPTRRLAGDIELAAYRIAQEALGNAIRHAQADRITVRVTFDAEGLVLQVIDNGVGFELPQHPSELTQSGHYGLVGIKERASLLGGNLEIRSSTGHGTEITAELPAVPRTASPQPEL